MSELKNCPFCGGEAGFKHIFENPEKCMAGCRECDLVIDAIFSNECEALAAWNHRTDHIGETTEKMPLTLDELRQMDGEPVWIEDLEEPINSEWRLCHLDRRKYLVLTSIHMRGYLQDDYGKTWLAYRAKPKEEHHETD